MIEEMKKYAIRVETSEQYGNIRLITEGELVKLPCKDLRSYFGNECLIEGNLFMTFEDHGFGVWLNADLKGLEIIDYVDFEKKYEEFLV